VPIVNLFNVEISVDAAQSRAARGLLNWSQSDLVVHSGVSKKTIADFERGTTRPYGRTLAAMIAAFEAAGIEFINRGVRMRTSPKKAQRKVGRGSTSSSD
jgi:transcriptional regulator with XRE-family HTH domain